MSGKRHPLNMRTTAELRAKLGWAATQSGRSLAQEVEYRLERSFIEVDPVQMLATLLADIRQRLEGLESTVERLEGSAP